MKYTVTFFAGGRITASAEVEAKTHKGAFYGAIEAVPGFPAYTHIRLATPKKVFRYDVNYGKIKGDLRIFKCKVSMKFAILALVENHPEFFRYNSKEDRDATFDEVSECIKFLSAAYVVPSLEPTGITAFSEETGGSKTGLTERKISNGSAENVTILEKLTRLSIDKNSGKSNVGGMAGSAWSDGSPTARSKSNNSIFATVDVREGMAGVTPGMFKQNGKTVEVAFHSKINGDKIYQAKDGYLYKPGWLNFSYATLKVKSEKPFTGQLLWKREHSRHLGKTAMFTEALGHWHAWDLCWDPEWLELP